MAYSDKYRNRKSDAENRSAAYELFGDLQNELIQEYGYVRLNGFIHLAYSNSVKLVICDKATILMSPDQEYLADLYGPPLLERTFTFRMTEINDKWLVDRLSALEDHRFIFNYDSEHDLYYLNYRLF